MPKKLLIVYHSQSGATARLAAAARRGALLEENVDVLMCRAWDCDASMFRSCDGLVLACAENSGSLAGSMKDLLDRIYYPLQNCTMIKPYVMLVSAGNDGTGASRQLGRIANGLPFKKVMDDSIFVGEPKDEHFATCEEAGQTMAAGLALGIF